MHSQILDLFKLSNPWPSVERLFELSRTAFIAVRNCINDSEEGVIVLTFAARFSKSILRDTIECIAPLDAQIYVSNLLPAGI